MKIIFYRANYSNWFGKQIARFTKGEFSHVEIMFSDGLCFSSVSEEKGVRIKEMEVTPEEWEIIDIGHKDIEGQVKEYCMQFVGKKYDWLGILGFILSPIYDRIYGKPEKYYCSEIVTEVLCKFDIIECYQRISPNELYRKIQEKLK